jgi:uncharacterized damage-inducible protein DinB
MTLEAYLAYSDKCRPRLYKTLAEIEQVRDGILEREFSTTGTFNTIGKLLAHCHGAEERWVTMRLQNMPVPILYEDRAAQTLEGLVADGEQIRANTRAFLLAQTPASLQETREMALQDRVILPTIEEVLFHVLHHESWHRGQISLVLQQFGFDPPNFDYAVFLPVK